MDERSGSESGKSISMSSTQEGEKLYGIYLKVFGTIFAPRWDDLSEMSKFDWQRFYIEIDKIFK